jgi:hypothetical protein
VNGVTGTAEAGGPRAGRTWTVARSPSRTDVSRRHTAKSNAQVIPILHAGRSDGMDAATGRVIAWLKLERESPGRWELGLLGLLGSGHFLNQTPDNPRNSFGTQRIAQNKELVRIHKSLCP